MTFIEAVEQELAEWKDTLAYHRQYVPDGRFEAADPKTYAFAVNRMHDAEMHVESLTRMLHRLKAGMKTCARCKQVAVEIARNQYSVFYKCGCNQFKGVEWDWKTCLGKDGTEYAIGSAGSFILQCPNCGKRTYRMQGYEDPKQNEVCLFCRKEHIELVKWHDEEDYSDDREN